MAMMRASADSSRDEKAREPKKDVGARFGEATLVLTFSVLFTMESSWYPKLPAVDDAASRMAASRNSGKMNDR